MSFLSDFFKKRKQDDVRFNEYQKEDRFMEMVQERKKSHAEREMLKIMEEERQKCIRESLNWENRKRQAEDKLKARKMMSFNPEMFQHESILKEKKDFLRGGNF